MADTARGFDETCEGRDHQPPAGETDDMLRGRPDGGKNYELTFPFPARVLKSRRNVLRCVV